MASRFKKMVRAFGWADAVKLYYNSILWLRDLKKWFGLLAGLMP